MVGVGGTILFVKLIAYELRWSMGGNEKYLSQLCYITMPEYDDMEDRKFDNFQFVNFSEIMAQPNSSAVFFALHALMEIPDQ